MNKYTVVRFTNRMDRIEFKSFQAAAALLRKLGEGYFIQGPKRAWFFDDVSGKLFIYQQRKAS